MINPFEIFTQKPDKAPFKKWKESDLKSYSSDFFSLPEHPDVLVRKIVPLEMKKDENEKVTANKAIETWSAKAKEFQNFAERAGIRMAKTSYFVGNDPRFKSNIPKASSPAFMATTEIINGKNLEQVNEMDKKMADEIDTMFTSLFSGLFDSYKENGTWWGDYGNGQVMYGTTKDDKEPHIYIVDVDPRMTDWAVLSEEQKERFFWSDIDWIFSEMKEVENGYAHGTKQFENARKMFADIIAKMPAPTNETAIDLREQLIEEMGV